MQEVFKSPKTISAVKAAIEGNQYYAVCQPNTVNKCFRLYFRTGRKCGIPYALMPVTDLVNGELLKILAYELCITITGRNLEVLADAILFEQVHWIRESHSKKDDGHAHTFIENITITGKIIDAP